MMDWIDDNITWTMLIMGLLVFYFAALALAGWLENRHMRQQLFKERMRRHGIL